MAGVTPEDIWKGLERAGASSVQAAAIMGNAIAESSLDPEARAMDSNGYYSNGLWQFNEASYPDSRQLVTGNPMRDMLAQIDYLFAHGARQAARGATVSEAAGNFAATFERCQGCQPGGASYQSRQANAATVAGWASGGSWPASAGSASDTASLSSAQSAEASATCAWNLPGSGVSLFGWHPLGGACLLTKTQARALIGAGLLLGGTVVMLGGMSLLVVAALPAAPAMVKRFARQSQQAAPAPARVPAPA